MINPFSGRLGKSKFLFHLSILFYIASLTQYIPVICTISSAPVVGFQAVLMGWFFPISILYFFFWFANPCLFVSWKAYHQANYTKSIFLSGISTILALIFLFTYRRMLDEAKSAYEIHYLFRESVGFGFWLWFLAILIMLIISIVALDDSVKLKRKLRSEQLKRTRVNH